MMPPRLRSTDAWAFVIFLFVSLMEGNCNDFTKPYFNNEPPYHVKFSNNTGIKVACSAVGPAPLAVSWILVDGTQIGNVPGLRQIMADGTLVFPPFRSEEYRQDVHAVVYRCKATNPQMAFVSREVHIDAVMSQPYEPQVYDTFPLKSNTAVLKCHLPPFIGTHVVVSAWIKDNVIKIDGSGGKDGKYSVSSSDELFVMDIGPTDSGSTFRCQTMDKLTGENRLSSTAGRLFVSEPKGNVAPRIVDGTTYVTAKEGDTVILPCVAQGFPVPSVSWYTKSANGHLLSVFMGDRILKTKVAVVISNSRLTDTGTYICVVENVVGSEKREINLTIAAPLSVQIIPKRIKLDLNKSAHLRCIVTGAPIVAVFWMRNGKAFPSDDSENVRIHDSGIYQCFAQNDREMVHDLVQVNAGDSVPTVISKFKEKTLQPGEDISLQCTALGNPLPTVNWLLDDELVSGRLTTDVRTEDHKKTHAILHIRNAKINDGGLYTCVFSNKIGETEYSNRINVVGPLGVRPMTSKTAIAGGVLTLNCPYYGHPIQRITWYKGKTKLPKDPRHFVQDNGTLVITQVRRNVDNGRYTCVVHDSKGSAVTQDLDITVMIPPKIMPFSFQEELLREGMRARLQCVVSEGDSPITIQWFKDNANIPSQLGVNIRHIDEFSSILTIGNVSPRHNGNYTCKATNSATTTSQSARLNVNVVPKIIPFSFQHKFVSEGTQARVLCGLVEGDQPVKFTWLKDGQPIKQTDVILRPIDNFSSILSIASVSQVHTGNYTCVATNHAASSRFTADLIVNVPPKWVVEPNDTSIVVGKDVMLPCSTTGHPTPVVTWLKAEGHSRNTRIPIANGPDMRVLSNGTLVIYSVKEHHQGSYLCQSENGIEILGKMVDLRIHLPPLFLKPSEYINVRRGDRLQVVCNPRGDRPIHFTWHVHGSIVHDDKASRYKIRNSDKNNNSISELIIDKSERKDSTSFHCSARNTYGNNKFVIHVSVKDVPNAPKKLKFVETSNRTLTVTWTANDDNGSPITGYIVQYKQIKANWKDFSPNMTVIGTQTEGKITELRPSQKYHIRVLAENAIGLSEPSDEIEVVVAEEAPSASPQEVTVVATDSNSLKVTWKPPHKEHWNGVIRGYYVGYKIAGTAEPYTFRLLEVPEDYTDVLSLPLNDLIEFKQYSIVAQAFNDGGKGPICKEVIVITSESVPTKPPEEIRCSVLTSQSIHVTWQPPPITTVHGVLQGYKVIFKPVLRTNLKANKKQDARSSSSTKMTLQNLQKYTNYSIQVLAYTKKGDGVKSQPVFCRTLEDVPEAPADIKVLPATQESVLISWKAPEQPNGAIMSYTIYTRDKKEKINKSSTKGNNTVYEVLALTKGETYEFWVTASTVVGEGQRSRVVMQSPGMEKVAAKVASFDTEIRAPADRDVMLPCKVVGIPEPSKKWIRSGNPITTGVRLHILSDGSLLIKDAHPEDSDNYTCHVENERGDDLVTYSVIVQTPPEAVLLDVSLTTINSIEVQWKSKETGGSAILGYKLIYKSDQTSWITIELEPTVESHRLEQLLCGNKYQLYMVATNKLGDGKPTNIVTTSTKGNVPTVPIKETLIEEGSTFVTINLQAWQIDSCPIRYFVVEYQKLSATQWRLFSDDVKPEKIKLVLSDLAPATWYNLRIIAHSNAGTAAGEYTFATLTREGATIEPETISNTVPPNPLSIFSDMTFIIIGSGSAVLVLFASVAVLCFCSRKPCQKKHHHHRRHSNSSHSGHHRKSSRPKSEPDDYVDGSFTYLQAPAKNTGKKRKKNAEPTPYATAHLSEFKGKKDHHHSSSASKSVYPQISRPGSSLADSSCPSSSELLNFRHNVQQIPTAPPMSDAYGGNPAAFYSHVIKGDHQIPATPSRRFKDNMPPLPPLPRTPARNIITQRFLRSGDPGDKPDEGNIIFPPLPTPIIETNEPLGAVTTHMGSDTNYDAPWDVKGKKPPA